jgi:benzodiazapine receptor
MSRPWLLPFTIAAIAAMLVAGVGATMTDTTGWYETLNKPSWNPPPAAFGLIWTIIFALIVFAGVTAWRATPNRSASELLIGLFSLNGFFNTMWTVLFFQLRRPDWAMIELVLFWLSIVALIVVFGRYSRNAALLLMPYLIWVTIAGVLNWQIIQLNPGL